MKSPKSRYRAEIVFDKPLDGLGSIVSYTADTVAELKNTMECQAGKHSSHVRIWENMAEYPKFKWVEIESYNLNK